MATLSLGGISKVEIASDGSTYSEVPGIVSAELSTDNGSITLADGRQIKSSTTITVTAETIDVITTGSWYSVMETFLDTPLAATPANYKVKLTFKDGSDNIVLSNVNATALDFIPGADGEYARYSMSFVAAGVNFDDLTTITVS
jgi:hypothetical protein